MDKEQLSKLGINIKVTAAGLGGVLAAGGIILLGLGYKDMNGSEINRRGTCG